MATEQPMTEGMRDAIIRSVMAWLALAWLWWQERGTMVGPLLWRAMWGRRRDIEWLDVAEREAA